jgi:glycosyltransferase involved in cell wall biosynthesis
MHQAYSFFEEIWVPSSFVHDSIAKSSPIPVFKIPHAINVPPEGDGSRELFGLPRDKFLVLVMYDFDSYQYRKNPIDAIRAYIEAAGARADCGLVIKVTNGHKHACDRQILAAALDGLNSVYIFDSFFDEQTLEQLKRCCDCLMSLHRSEGFGLNLAEMMALGKPVIATGWSGNMEFMSPMNSMLVSYKLDSLAEDIGPYRKGLEWATPDIWHASSQLRDLIDNRDLRRTLGWRARLDIAKLLNPQKIGLQAKNRLSLLLSRQILR